jgi:hypothetical protein
MKKLFMKKDKLKIEITEMFMAKIDWNRYFTGTIKREWDDVRNPVFRSKIYVKDENHDEIIYSQATKSDENQTTGQLQDQLGLQVDEMLKLILDCGLTKMPAETVMLGEIKIINN